MTRTPAVVAFEAPRMHAFALAPALLLLTTTFVPLAAAGPAECVENTSAMLIEPYWPWQCGVSVHGENTHTDVTLVCDARGGAPRCFPIWVSLSQIPTGIVFTGGNEQGVSAGALLFAQGAVVGCFAYAPAPGTGAATLTCFP